MFFSGNNPNQNAARRRRQGDIFVLVLAMNAGLNAPLKAERLANGDTLLCESERVIEVNAGKQIVQSWGGITLPLALTDAERLPDGSTLVLDGGSGL